MKKFFLLAWLMMLSIVAVAQNEQVGNDLVIKNGAGTVIDIVSATESTEMKFDVPGNKLSIKKDGETKDISLDEVKTITTVPAFKLVAQDKYVYTSTSPVILHFKLSGNDHGEMKPVSGESVRFTAGKGKLASTTATTNDDGVATVEYTPEQSLWAPGFEDVINALYTFTDSQGRVSRYTAKAFVEHNGDYEIECLTPDQNLGPNEEAEAEFAVYEVSPSGRKPCAGVTIEFSAPEGYITTQSTVTDENGRVRVTFHNQSDDAKEYLVRARYNIWNNGEFYTGTATAKFIALNYKLEADNPKLAVRNDGSEQYCFFSLYEYHNGEWQLSQKDVEAKFEATNVTLTTTSDKNRGYGFIASFTAGKSFQEGSVTAKCDIPLESGKVWQGVATTELVLDDYLFFRAIPVDAVADIYPEQSQDVMFTLVKIVNGVPQPCQGMEVEFRCLQGGTLSNTLVKTDANGEAATTFELNQGEDYATVYANCTFADEQGVWHSYAESVDFELTPYKLEALTPKLGIRNDGSEQDCLFSLYEYHNGEWLLSPKDVDANFEATNVTLTNTSDKNRGYGFIANFTAGKSFNQGSVTAECEIMLDNGRIWKGKATTELVLDDYLFFRAIPVDAVAGIYPEESQDVVFKLVKIVNGQPQPCQGMKVEFECLEGTLTNTTVKTDAQGEATTTFQLNKDEDYATVIVGCSFADEQGIWHSYSESVDFVLTPYKLKCLTPEVEMKKGDASATVHFELEEYKNGQWVACPGKRLQFSATNGTVQPTYADTNQNGICQTLFSPTTDATEGTVTGMCTIPIELYGKTVFTWKQSQTAHITITDDNGGEGPGGGDDEQLKKAEKLKENTYEIKNKKTGVTEVRDYKTQWSEWTKDQDAVQFQLEDADDDGGTKGMVYGFIPKNMVNLVLKIAKETFVNTPGAKFGFEKFEGGQVMGNFMSTTDHTEGNIKPESRMILRPVKSVSPVRTRAGADDYTGEYELLFYLVFNNEVWNNETQQMEEGDEYEIYGRGTMKMHIPTITSFQVKTEEQYVKVGNSTKVVLEQYYEEGATWDWNDVQIIGQSTDYSKARNGEDEGFFSWDAATQTLTSLKSNNNDRVNVCLGLISKPNVKHTLFINTGEGWKYTMIKASTDVIECKANSYPSFDFDWAPKESADEKLDFNALELDPDCAPAGYFAFPSGYQRQGWPIFVSSKCKPGEYNLRFRVKSNHDVNCTMKFIVTPEE